MSRIRHLAAAAIANCCLAITAITLRRPGATTFGIAAATFALAAKIRYCVLRYESFGP